MANFSRLTVNNWRQFEHVDIDLSKQITVLTGQNGCGKTTILNLLSRHFGWNLQFVSTPYIGKKTAKRLWSDIYDDLSSDFENVANGRVSIGSISYDDGQICELFTNTLTSIQYMPDYSAMNTVDGMHIPSHRGITTYSNVSNIPTEPITSAQQYQQFQQLLTQAYGGGRADNAGRIQKQSLISLALLGEGNSHVTPNPEMKRVFKGFQAVLREVLPSSLGFRRIEIRMPEVVLVTDSGTFALDAMSGGISAIFSIAWQIYMFGHDKSSFSITIDEPENHLHPSMQRTFLPKLAKAFPKCRIITATHSPFIVSSFPEANVVALTRSEGQRIISEELDLKDISGTPNEVLREILDVSSNLPLWVEGEIEKVIERASKMPPEKRARHIMQKLKKLGISDAIVEYKRER
ncbi:AAA family ATPase [Ensifer sp. D2-11]